MDHFLAFLINFRPLKMETQLASIAMLNEKFTSQRVHMDHIQRVNYIRHTWKVTVFRKYVSLGCILLSIAMFAIQFHSSLFYSVCFQSRLLRFWKELPLRLQYVWSPFQQALLWPAPKIAQILPTNLSSLAEEGKHDVNPQKFGLPWKKTKAFGL